MYNIENTNLVTHLNELVSEKRLKHLSVNEYSDCYAEIITNILSMYIPI